MADIIIKGMEMPKSCEDCWMTYEGDSDNCPAVNESVCKFMVAEARHPRCPLVALPEHHGRLIDESELVRIADEICRNPLGAILEDVSTIVEATE